MKVVLLEDDSQQADILRRQIQERHPCVSIVRIATESEFYARIEELEMLKAALYIMDVMVKWRKVGETAAAKPKEVESEGRYRAGLRCMNALRAREATKATPVILYTILVRSDLKDELGGATNMVHISKNSDPEGILAEMRRVLGL